MLRRIAPSREARTSPTLLLCVLIGLAAVGCGKKGPPRAPEPRSPLPAESIVPRQSGMRMQIDFTAPAARGPRPGQKPASAELVRVTYPPGVVPPADPDSFRRRGDIVDSLPPGRLEAGARSSLVDETLDRLADGGLGWTLRYAVRIRDTRGRPSILAVAHDLVPLESIEAPRALLGEPTAGGIRLTWRPPADETEFTFNVYRATPGDRWPDTPLNAEPLAVNEFLDVEVDPDDRYAYTIRVVLAPGQPYREGNSSTPVQVVAADRFAPAAPAGLVSVQEGRAVRLFWNPNPERDLAGYRVYRREGDEDWRRLEPALVDQNSFLDSEVTSGQRLSYRVTAVDRAVPPNESEPSEAVALELVEEPVNPGGAER